MQNPTNDTGLSPADEALVRAAMSADARFDIDTYRLYRQRIAARLNTVKIEVQGLERDLAMADLSIQILDEQERSASLG